MEKVTKEKILLLLFGGLNFAYAYTPSRKWRILKKISRDWKRLDEKQLRKEINYLYRIKILDKESNSDGSVSIHITEKGVLRALNYQLADIKNKKGAWDGKWRMVAFDIPEPFKRGRDALRNTLKNIGFCELQKSVFICPYDCIKEMRLLIEFFRLDKHVRLGILEFIDNEEYFKKVFKLENL